MMSGKFTHLHLHTPYSLLDGFTKIDQMLEKAKNSGMNAVAVTDHGNMFGAVEFYKKAKKIGIKPIIGCEMYTAARTVNDKESIDKKSGHLILLAKNNEGYQNLIKLVSIAYVDGFYYKPRVDYELLRKYSKGLIALSACLAGDIQQNLLAGNYKKAKEIALYLEDTFGENNFYLEMQDHGIREQKLVNVYLRKLSQDTGIPLVATNDVHYVNKSDSKEHEILLCIQTNKTLSDEHRMEFETKEFYFKTAEEMYELFPGDTQALENTCKIADMCNIEFEFGSYHLPEYKAPEGYTAESFFIKLCEKGLKERYKTITPEIRQRFDYEIDTIRNMGYVEYFLIVWDFINYAKNMNIAVGPGRGSAAGSIVSYCLKITDVDPLRFNLLFERFLNPERISMPDIDVDFCYEKRDSVIEYVKEKYGKSQVSQIITFGTFGARLAVRDCARVLGISYSKADKLAKQIPNQAQHALSISEALAEIPNLKKEYEEDPEIKTLMDSAMSIEGLPRHTSTHAAGIVITKNPVDTYVPLYVDDGNITTQFTMTELEELGLLKMDFLSLRNLTVIQKTLDLINKYENLRIDLTSIDFDDKNIYELISSGNTLGIFQLESSGMKNFMKLLKPENIEDVIAGISLYRPGPMDSIPKYLENKNNPKNIAYTTDKLKPILGVTRGVLVYQEQVMQVVRDLAGYSYARSDLVRRAMSKKKMNVMEHERNVFIYGDEKDGIKGCVNNGVSAETANEIYDDMIDFGNYAYNKSHATAYAIISYRTAYLKCYYPLEFMAAMMSSVIDNTDKVVEYKTDLEENGIKILPVDINKSELDFTVEKNAVRFPLQAIKGIGKPVAYNIIKNRSENGPYKNFGDVITRLDSKNINKKVAEGLIKSGALDSIITNRATAMTDLDKKLQNAKNEKRSNISGQVSFFNLVNDQEDTEDELTVNEFDKKLLLKMEKEALGFYISGHPLDDYQDLIKEFTNINSQDIKKSSKDQMLDENKTYRYCGIIQNIKVITTKNHKLMAFMTVEDKYSSVEVIVFPNVYEKSGFMLNEDAIVLVSGHLSLQEENDAKILADNIEILTEQSLTREKKLYIRLNGFAKNIDTVKRIENIIKEDTGKIQVCFYDEHSKKVVVNEKQKIRFNDNIMDKLISAAGQGNVKLVI